MPQRAFDAACRSRAGFGAAGARPDRIHSWVFAMLDFLMLVYGVGFFAAAILYVLACERM
jgi:hypothetical protein